MGLCVRFYNKIPEEILNLSDNKFKLKIKEVLCKKAYYTINDYLCDKKAWLNVPSAHISAKNKN